MPTQQAKNRSAKALLTISDARGCKVIESHYSGESWRKDRKSCAKLHYWATSTHKLYQGKGPGFSIVGAHSTKTACWSTQQRIMLRSFLVRPSLGPCCFNAPRQRWYQGTSAAQLTCRDSWRALFPCKSWGSQFKRKVIKANIT